MRLRTVKSRVRKVGLPKQYIEEIFLRMKGISDESVSKIDKYNEFWIMTVKEVLHKYCKNVHEEARRRIG